MAVLGDTDRHRDAIAALAATHEELHLHTPGVVDALVVRDHLQSSRVCVVPSNHDANPRVIAESLASDTPVACAAVISGGSFQITSKTGMLFAPNAQSLAETAVWMLGNTSTFSPREHCITIEQATDQIERIAGSPAKGSLSWPLGSWLSRVWKSHR